MTLAPGKALRFVWGEEVAELAKTDPRIVVLDGDLGSSTGAYIFEEAHPDRFFQMGIAEQNLLGVAAGMATVGFVPFVSTFACFAVARALDSIRVLIAQPSLNVKITGGYAGLLASMTGKTHLMWDDVAIMRSMAHMTVVAPADEVEARQAIRAIVDYHGPVYLRLTRSDSPILFGSDYEFVLGKSTVIREGGDLTVFSTEIPYLSRSAASGPDSPKVSASPSRFTGTGYWSDSVSATAPPRPPMIVCSSEVTTNPVRRAAATMPSSSSGLIVGTCTRWTSIPSAASSSAAS